LERAGKAGILGEEEETSYLDPGVGRNGNLHHEETTVTGACPHLAGAGMMTGDHGVGTVHGVVDSVDIEKVIVVKAALHV
jgi:hypothetical protein